MEELVNAASKRSPLKEARYRGDGLISCIIMIIIRVYVPDQVFSVFMLNREFFII